MNRADLTLFRADGSLAAVVEVKRRTDTSTEWATLLRRNMLAHGGFPASEFFLLVTPDHLYVWRNAGSEPALVEPDAVIESAPLLSPYFEWLDTPPASVSGPTFESLVGAWLSDLRDPASPAAEAARSHGLTGLGLLEALQGGRIEYEAAA